MEDKPPTTPLSLLEKLFVTSWQPMPPNFLPSACIVKVYSALAEVIPSLSLTYWKRWNHLVRILWSAAPALPWGTNIFRNIHISLSQEARGLHLKDATHAELQEWRRLITDLYSRITHLLEVSPSTYVVQYAQLLPMGHVGSFWGDTETKPTSCKFYCPHILITALWWQITTPEIITCGNPKCGSPWLRSPLWTLTFPHWVYIETSETTQPQQGRPINSTTYDTQCLGPSSAPEYSPYRIIGSQS